MSVLPLHLTATEKKSFLSLPSTLQQGWSVADEVLSTDDTPKALEARLSLLRVHDPALRSLRDSIRHGLTVEQLAKTIATMTLSQVTDDDLLSILFAVGPRLLTSCIEYLISIASKDSDLESIAAIAFIRHSILLSYVSANA